MIKEKIKAIWAKNPKPIKALIGAVLLSVGLPVFLATPAGSLVYSGTCTAIEAECD